MVDPAQIVAEAPVVDPEVDVEVADQAKVAHEARLKGASWIEAAEEAGYADVASCRLAIRARLQRAALDNAAENRAEAREMELQRLDALIKPQMPMALMGDLDAARFVLSVETLRSRIEGFERPTNDKVENRTIIVTGDALAAFVTHSGPEALESPNLAVDLQRMALGDEQRTARRKALAEAGHDVDAIEAELVDSDFDADAVDDD